MIKFKKYLFASYISNAVSMASGLVYVIYINNSHSTTVYGQFSIIVAVVAIFITVLSSRTGEATIRYEAHSVSKNNYRNFHSAIFLGAMIDVVSAAAVISIIYSLALPILQSFGGDSSMLPELRFYLLFVAIAFIKSIPYALLQIFGKKNIINLSIIADGVLKLVAILLLDILTENNALTNVVWSTVFSAAVATTIVLITACISFYKTYDSFSPELSAKFLIDYLQYTKITFLSSSIKSIIQNLPTLIIGNRAGPGLVGVYETIVKLSGPIVFFSSPFPQLLLAKFSRALAEKKYVVVKKLIQATFLIVMAGLGAVVMLFIGEQEMLFSLAGVQHDDVLAILLIMAFSIAINSCLWWTKAYSNFVNPRIALKINTYSVFFLSIFLFVAMKYAELLGVALVMLGFRISLMTVYVGHLLRYFKRVPGRVESNIV